MAEPTGAYSFDYLVKEIAKILGSAFYGTGGTEEAMVPVNNRHDFDLCRGIVNDGVKLFMAQAPAEGWNWRKRIMSVTLAPGYTGTADSADATSITDSDIAGAYDDDYFNGYLLRITSGTGVDETATVTDYDGTAGTFTFSGGLSGGSTPDTTSAYTISRSTDVIDADPARYQLDQFFGGEPAGPITYAKDTSHSTMISFCSESKIRTLRSLTVQSGYPYYAAIRPYGTRRYELIVDPQPSSADVLEFPYLSHFDSMNLEGGVSTSGNATTLVDTVLNTYGDFQDDYFNGWILTILSGTGKGETATITDWDHTTSTFTFSGGLSGGSTISSGSYYIVQPATNRHPAGVEYDPAIRAACLAQAESETENFDEGWEERFYKIHLPAAYRINARQAGMSRRLGKITNGPSSPRTRTWNEVQFGN